MRNLGYNLPDGERAELIDGELYMMATPNRIHQKLVKDFTYLIEEHIKRKKSQRIASTVYRKFQ